VIVEYRASQRLVAVASGIAAVAALAASAAVHIVAIIADAGIRVVIIVIIAIIGVGWLTSHSWSPGIAADTADAAGA
jgi:hypothetical protein